MIRISFRSSSLCRTPAALPMKSDRPAVCQRQRDAPFGRQFAAALDRGPRQVAQVQVAIMQVVDQLLGEERVALRLGVHEVDQLTRRIAPGTILTSTRADSARPRRARGVVSTPKALAKSAWAASSFRV